MPNFLISLLSFSMSHSNFIRSLDPGLAALSCSVILAALCAILGGAAPPLRADELRTFPGVTYVDKPSNDGDSFTVKIPSGKEECGSRGEKVRRLRDVEMGGAWTSW